MRLLPCTPWQNSVRDEQYIMSGIHEPLKARFQAICVSVAVICEHFTSFFTDSLKNAEWGLALH